MNIQIPFNLNQALSLSLNVAAAAIGVPGIYADLTTNAAQFEPGEFANGVTNFNPDNVFILHNAGAAFGASQRFAYMGVASQVPFTLQQLQVNIYTNALGSSASNPVVVAVEMSPSDDFANYTSLGTVKSNQGNPQTLALSNPIPAGITYVRLRSTSPIPDGSNYLAYSGINLAGTTIPGEGVNPPEPIDPTAGKDVATWENFTVTYDFNRAANNALMVAVGGPAQKKLVSLLGTNALAYEPGEFSNGVTSFGSIGNVFIIHNSGSAQGANQRYPFAVVATQLPLVVKVVIANFTSNASGSSPTNPVSAAIEASFTPDFQNVSTLGSVSTVSPASTVAALLPSGMTYIRLRATTPIPDGSNYIAFSAITLDCARVVDTLAD
ncbi:hypothetical protein GQ53DRAFT_811543 [Thozetella sp. PMI_491]|nr:hypothetical protein GQ53DRAFT_811543 [Thozetella sp. PMI_491]